MREEKFGSLSFELPPDKTVFEGGKTKGLFVLQNKMKYQTITLTGPWLKIFGIYNGNSITIQPSSHIYVYPTFDILNVINVHTSFARGVYADSPKANGLIPTDIMTSMVNVVYGGEATLWTNYSASGMNAYNVPTLENFYIHFSDKWGDALDLWNYVIGFEFLVSERTPVPQPETIYRARQKVMDMS